MTTANTAYNDLLPRAIFSHQIDQVGSLSYPVIQIDPITSPASGPIGIGTLISPEIEFTVVKPDKTPNYGKIPDSLTVLTVPREISYGDWHLNSILVVQLRRTRKQSVASTWLEGVSEYGSGATEGEAVADLVVSLGEYRESLEQREGTLGTLGRSAVKELAALRKLIERFPSTD